MKTKLLILLLSLITVLGFNSCDKTNYAAENEVFIGFWYCAMFRYSATMQIFEDGKAEYHQEIYEPGSNILIKEVKKKGKFKIKNEVEMTIGTKKFIITKQPEYFESSSSWLLELNDTMVLVRSDNIGPDYELD